MIKELWINLPVKDVGKSKEFFTKIGFILNTEHGNSDDSACFLVGEKNIVVIITERHGYCSWLKTIILRFSARESTRIYANKKQNGRFSGDKLKKRKIFAPIRVDLRANFLPFVLLQF